MPSGRRRWGAVVVALLVAALLGLWASPDGPVVLSRAEAVLARIASAAREAATGAEARRVWQQLREAVETRRQPAEGAAPNPAEPLPDPRWQEDPAASARIAEASRLVERANAAAAPQHAAQGP